MRKGIGKMAPFEMPAEKKVRAEVWRRGEKSEQLPPGIGISEVLEAAEGLKLRKTPGPDGVPPEIVVAVARAAPEVFRKVVGKVFRERRFLHEWIQSRVSLLWKGKGTMGPSDYRPICLSSALGKFVEEIIKTRIEDALEAGEGLSGNQYGFRQERSTLQAVHEILRRTKGNGGKWRALVSFDIRNAFNTASWGKIVAGLVNRGVPGYLVEMVEEFIDQRKIVVERESTK